MVKPSNSESDSNINRKSKNVIRINNKDKLSGKSKDKPVRKKLPFSTSPQNNKNDDVKKVEKRGTTKSASLERYKSPSAKRLQKSRSDETETLSSIPRSLRTAPNSERRKSSDNKKEERSSSSGPTSNNRSSSPPVPALQNRSNSPPVPALQNRTLSPPVPALQRKCISLPIIKITDFDDGNTEIYYTDSCEYDDDDDDDESPYGTTELLSESEDRIYKTKKKNEDSSKIDSRYKKPVTPSLPKPRPSSSITTYKQYKLEIQRQKDKEKKAKRSQSFDEPINLRRSRKVNLKDAEDILNIYEDQRKYAKPKEPPNSSRNKKYVKLKKNGGEYVVSEPQGDDLYRPNSTRPVSLPPLQEQPIAPPPKSRKKKSKSGKKNSVLYPYIHGLSAYIDSRASSSMSTRFPSAANLPSASKSKSKSKDDSNIQYEFTLNEVPNPPVRTAKGIPQPWRARKIRIFRNNDRFFPGIEYTFRIGRDVLNMEGLCDKISDRIGLSRGARYIFGLDGSRKYRLEELEDGGSYVASSDRKFVNLAYNKRRQRLSNRKKGAAKKRVRTGSPVVKLAGKRGDSSDSGNSTGSSNGKPSSREGRMIKIISNGEKPQEVSVLVNMKTVQSWEDVVADLGQVLKRKGEMQLFTPDGQEVKSFSQFKNDFANVDTFTLKTNFVDKIKKIEENGAVESRPPSSTSTLPDIMVTPRTFRDDDKRKMPRTRRLTPASNLRKFASEPTLKEAAEEKDDVEVAEPRVVSVLVDGQRKTLYPPKTPVTHNPTAPDLQLTLDWVYGYRGADTKRNLWVLATDELLYFVAAVAVIYDRRLDTQRHYTEHTEDIQCMALHPTRDLVASGQRATRGHKMSAHVRVWSTRSLITLHILGEREMGMGIMAVAFSQRNRGLFLLAVDADQEHLLSVWTWENEKVFGKVATHHDFIYGASFHPMDNNLIIIYGKKLLSLWVRRKDGIFTKTLLLGEDSNRIITSLEFAPTGDLITGDSEGEITVWTINIDGQYHIKMEYKAHDGPISSLQQLSEGTILSGGEKDRKVIAWDTEEDFEKIEETRLPDSAGGVRTLYPQRPGECDGNIYVGTTRNMILEGSLQRKFNQIVFGHSKQLWGLAVNQNDGTVATAGYDRQIVKWRNNRLDWRIQAQGECVSVAIHPYSTVIVAGTIDGHIIVLNALTGMHVVTVRVCGSPISCLMYNLTGDTLVAGSQNGSMYLFRSSKDGFVYTRYGRMSGFQPISCIDWSESGQYLQTVTSDNDLAYWNLRNLTFIKNHVEVRDEIWLSQTCPLSYMVHGIWCASRGTTIHITVDKNENRGLLAAGDTEGFIRLYRYPVLSPKAGWHEYKVYTSYLSCARFSPEEDLLYTTGGTDAAFMRWKLE